MTDEYYEDDYEDEDEIDLAQRLEQLENFLIEQYQRQQEAEAAMADGGYEYEGDEDDELVQELVALQDGLGRELKTSELSAIVSKLGQDGNSGDPFQIYADTFGAPDYANDETRVGEMAAMMEYEGASDDEGDED